MNTNNIKIHNKWSCPHLHNTWHISKMIFIVFFWVVLCGMIRWWWQCGSGGRSSWYNIMELFLYDNIKKLLPNMFYCVPPFTVVSIQWKRGNMSFLNFSLSRCCPLPLFVLFLKPFLSKGNDFLVRSNFVLDKRRRICNKGKKDPLLQQPHIHFLLRPFLSFFKKL